MKKFVIGVLLISSYGALNAQTKYIDRHGKASFFSSAPLEDIKARSDQAVSVFDIQTGEIVASVLMRTFHFRKSLMEEHFNENYVESDKYPKSNFTGRVTNIDQVDFTADGKYLLEVSGEMTLHGVTRHLEVKADAVVSNGTIQATAVFPLRVEDFKIDVPRLVIHNIAEVMEVTISFNYQPVNP